MSDTKHDEREVEALARQVHLLFHAREIYESPYSWSLSVSRAVARFVLSREAALVEALESLCRSVIEGPHVPSEECLVCIEYARKGRAVLAAHRAARQPSEPRWKVFDHNGWFAVSDTRNPMSNGVLPCGALFMWKGDGYEQAQRANAERVCDALNATEAALAREQAKP